MRLLEDRILADGKVCDGAVLKVGTFLNHCIDISLLREMGKEFKTLYNDCEVTKILTIEASGIAIACVTAQFFNCPVVFAKKSASVNLTPDVISERVHSYTHGNDYDAVVQSGLLTPEDCVLIIDDFLANGAALNGLIGLCRTAGARIAGAGIAIEKVFQGGGNAIREKGIRVESLAKIISMDNNKIVFG